MVAFLEVFNIAQGELFLEGLSLGSLDNKTVNIGCKQFPEFDVRKDPENVYACFVKYAKRFKDNHLKAYNIRDKAQHWSLFLDSIGESTLDIFEQARSRRRTL